MPAQNQGCGRDLSHQHQEQLAQGLCRAGSRAGQTRRAPPALTRDLASRWLAALSIAALKRSQANITFITDSFFFFSQLAYAFLSKHFYQNAGHVNIPTSHLLLSKQMMSEHRVSQRQGRQEARAEAAASVPLQPRVPAAAGAPRVPHVCPTWSRCPGGGSAAAATPSTTPGSPPHAPFPARPSLHCCVSGAEMTPWKTAQPPLTTRCQDFLSHHSHRHKCPCDPQRPSASTPSAKQRLGLVVVLLQSARVC